MKKEGKVLHMKYYNVYKIENNEKEYGPLEERTPTILKLFYGILRKYPDHILNVKWRYDMALDDPERPF